MDILGMLNDFIKDNKTDEQLAKEFIKLLNKGQSLEKIASLYEITPIRIKEIIKIAGNKNDVSSDQVKYTNVNQLTLNSDINNQTNDKLANKFRSLLNRGHSIDGIAKQYEYPIEKVKEILISTGYKNIVDSYERNNIKTAQAKPPVNNSRNIKTDEQLADEFVTLLNRGQSIEKVAEIQKLSIET
jgi:hypothetical protein